MESSLKSTRQHAVVIGASMAGLLAARVLSDHFAKVTILERDVLPDQAETRKGVPQGRHAHAILASGYRVISGLFPHIDAALDAVGAPRGDAGNDVVWFQQGRYKVTFESGMKAVAATRPMLEGEVRKGVRALANVEIRDGVDVAGPCYDAASERVTGVTFRQVGSVAEETIDADLVIDASGRGSQTPKWLEQWGYERPAQTEVKIDLGYSTRTFEARPGDLGGKVAAIIGGQAPQETCYAAMIKTEGNQWIVTLVGVAGAYAPADNAGWMEFAKALPTSDIYDVVSTAKPLTDVVVHKFPHDQRRHYEKLKRFPGGYLVLGDGVCSFNPTYGQGMSVAALEVEQLDACLAKGDADLAKRFFKAIKPVVDIPWTVVTGEDLRYPQVDGSRPAPMKVINGYMDRLHAVASEDPIVAKCFFEVANLMKAPPVVFAPKIFWRVMTKQRRIRKTAPVVRRAAAVKAEEKEAVSV